MLCGEVAMSRKQYDGLGESVKVRINIMFRVFYLDVCDDIAKCSAMMAYSSISSSSASTSSPSPSS
jgi:hypothetical protein